MLSLFLSFLLSKMSEAVREGVGIKRGSEGGRELELREGVREGEG